jgi:molecular chaperone DnaK (HSP70)
MALQRLEGAAEKAKMELSSTNSTDINLPSSPRTRGGPSTSTIQLTRAKFEQLVDDLITRTIEPMRKALKDAGSSRRTSTRCSSSAARPAFRRSRKRSRSSSARSRTRV